MARLAYILIATCMIIGLVFGLRQLGRMHYVNLHANVNSSSTVNTKTSLTDNALLNWIYTKTTRQGSIHALVASIMVIIVSELCDKTFFIAAILSMKSSRSIVYAGAMSALVLMTIISALLGNVVTVFLSPRITHYASTFLFGVFGLKMLFDGLQMNNSNDCTEEYEEAKSEIESKQRNDIHTGKYIDLEGGKPYPAMNHSSYCNTMFLHHETLFILCQAFVMTFLAEWGDRSQITTFVLAAKENNEIVFVVIGSCLGHGFCTGLAVIGGKILANRISIRSITLLSAFVFLAFTISSLFFIPLEVI